MYIRLFLTTFFIVTSVALYADCDNGGMSIFPQGNNIKSNTVFVLNGYAESQHIILELNRKFNIYLQTGNEKIKLDILEMHVGEFKLTQTVLKPAKELTIGSEYILHIDNLPGDEIFKRLNLTNGNYEEPRFYVSAEQDTKMPILKSIPKIIEKRFVQYGCGPEKYVIFDFPIQDESELIVKTTVKNTKSGKESIFYIEPDAGKLKVGHGMCSGAFKFIFSSDYEVEFSIMDASGNLTAWTGKRIKFARPTNIEFE